MACIFCDQTPETENAVEALTAIKNGLQLLPGSTPDEVATDVIKLYHNLIAKDRVLQVERGRRQSIEKQCEQNAERLRRLEQIIAEQQMRNPAPPAYRGPSSSPSRAARGDDISWHQAETPVHRMKDGSIYRVKFGLPYGHTSKKDRVK